jgi:chorismate synthase
MTQIGEVPIAFESWEHVPNNPFFAPVADVSALEDYMQALRKVGDSCGARIRVVASGVPVGLGEPLFDKMDADIAYAMMGINAVKGVEIGAGFRQRGAARHDARRRAVAAGLRRQQRRRRAWRHQHRAGPGGADRDQAHQLHPVAARVDRHGNGNSRSRSSPRAGMTPASASAPRRLPRRMLALVVMEHALRHRAQCGDVRSGLAPVPAAAPLGD